MNLSDFNIGTKVEITIYDEYTKKSREKHNSIILEHDNNDTLVVAAPISAGKIVPIHRETVIGLLVAVDESMYKFDAKVEKRGTKDKIVVLVVKKIGKFEKIQRRDFFRFKWINQITFTIDSSKEDDEEIQNSQQEYQALTKDISGGGIAIVTKKELKAGELLTLYINIPNGTKLKLKGKVVRCFINYKVNDMYDAGISFVQIDNSSRSEIIKFIFQKQAELKQKGLI